MKWNERKCTRSASTLLSPTMYAKRGISSTLLVTACTHFPIFFCVTWTSKFLHSLVSVRSSRSTQRKLRKVRSEVPCLRLRSGSQHAKGTSSKVILWVPVFEPWSQGQHWPRERLPERQPRSGHNFIVMALRLFLFLFFPIPGTHTNKINKRNIRE